MPHLRLSVRTAHAVNQKQYNIISRFLRNFLDICAPKSVEYFLLFFKMLEIVNIVRGMSWLLQ